MQNALANIPAEHAGGLPALVDRAAAVLTNARSAAEVLEARDMAATAYDAAKRAARIGKAKKAADDLIAAAYRVQADALEIEAGAKRRLADEYDAAQANHQIAKPTDNLRRGSEIPKENIGKPTARDAGISPKEMHEARIIRDAEKEEPGIIRRALDAMVKSGEEPTRAEIKRTALKAAKRKPRSRGPRFQAPQETEHDRDLRMLLGVWEAACESARKAFIETVA